LGAIRFGSHQVEIAFAPAGQEVRTAIDTAYQAKYARYGSSYLRPMLAEQAVAATLRVTPTEPTRTSLMKGNDR
jgi:hypothetical protein